MTKTSMDPRQLPLLLPDSSWRPVAEFPSLRDVPVIGLDTETQDPGLATETGSSWARGDGRLIGFSLAFDGFQRYYPLEHPEDNLEDPVQALAWLREELRDYPGLIVGQNLPYDLGWLDRYDIRAPLAKFWETRGVEVLINDTRPGYSLDHLCRYHGLPGKDETLLREAALAYRVDPKSGMWRMPARFVGPYAEADADRPLRVREKQLAVMAALPDELKLDRIVGLENDLVMLNMLMRKRGVRVDLDRVAQVKRTLQDREREQHVIMHDLTDLNVDIWSGRSVATAFMQVGLEFPTTALDQPSFEQAWLEQQPHPVAQALVRARKYNKAWSTFIDGTVFEHVTKQGRLHPEWHPLRADDGGTISGRYACSEPNAQQTPVRDEEIGTLLRSMYVPDEGCDWWVFDVAQQEPRFTVHYAALMNFPRAQEAAAKIRENPRTDYHQMVADMTGLPRKSAKTINLGKAYGMGGAKLCHSLGLPTEWWEPGDGRSVEVAGPEGKRIIKQYDNLFPFIKNLSKSCSTLAETRGWLRTYGGRICRFDLWRPPGWGNTGKALPYEQAVDTYGEEVVRAFTHKAMNRLIQGSSGDMLKLAMLKIWRETGQVTQVTIHDEVDMSLDSVELAREVDRCVRTSVELQVPLLTDAERGPSWGELEKVEL